MRLFSMWDGLLDLFRKRYFYSQTLPHLYLTPETFAGKRILVVGPAETADDEMSSVDLDSFDFVIRMNKAIDVPFHQNGKPQWRIDILFHSFNEEGERSAGVLTQEKLRRSGTHTVVYRAPSRKSLERLRDLHQRKLADQLGVKFNVLPLQFHLSLKEDLGGASPTTGFSCLMFLLGCDFSHLKIVGFTFFTTPYLVGYNDKVSSAEGAVAWGAANGHHDPQKELARFSDKVKQVRGAGGNLSLGQALEKIID